MARDLTIAVRDETLAAQHRWAILAEFDFLGGVVRMWDGLGDLSWNGNSYIGGGSLVGMEPPEESSHVGTSRFSFLLSGMPPELISIALAEQFQGRRALSWLAFFGADNQAIADPIRWCAGRMDGMDIVYGGDTATILVTVENFLNDSMRPREVRYTNEEQQRLAPGDRGLEYIASMAGKEVFWGQDAPDGADSGFGPRRPIFG